MSARDWRAAREGDTYAAPRKHPKTPESLIVGVGASGALLAGAAIVFVTLVGLVSFNVWPSANPILSTGSVELSPANPGGEEGSSSPVSEASGELASADVPAGATSPGGGGARDGGPGKKPGSGGTGKPPAGPGKPVTPPATASPPAVEPPADDSPGESRGGTGGGGEDDPVHPQHPGRGGGSGKGGSGRGGSGEGSGGKGASGKGKGGKTATTVSLDTASESDRPGRGRGHEHPED